MNKTNLKNGHRQNMRSTMKEQHVNILSAQKNKIAITLHSFIP